jgi:hypothetical protein
MGFHLRSVTPANMYPMTTVKVARVDCTDPSAQFKCREHHINAFPTVRVYRRGNNQVVAGNHEHQAYYGDRTPEAIAAFADLQVQSLDKKVQLDKKVNVRGLPGLHTMQNLNEYLRALSEHGVNQVLRGRQRARNRSACD